MCSPKTSILTIIYKILAFYWTFFKVLMNIFSVFKFKISRVARVTFCMGFCYQTVVLQSQLARHCWISPEVSFPGVSVVRPVTHLGIHLRTVASHSPSALSCKGWREDRMNPTDRKCSKNTLWHVIQSECRHISVFPQIAAWLSVEWAEHDNICKHKAHLRPAHSHSSQFDYKQI